MKHLTAAILLLASQSGAATVPPSPIATGPLESIFKVLKAAKSCHVDQLRIVLYPSDRDEARLFLLQDPQDDAVRCFDTWLTHHGRRLHLLPRWWNDDFTKDRP